MPVNWSVPLSQKATTYLSLRVQGLGFIYCLGFFGFRILWFRVQGLRLGVQLCFEGCAMRIFAIATFCSSKFIHDIYVGFSRVPCGPLMVLRSVPRFVGDLPSKGVIRILKTSGLYF